MKLYVLFEEISEYHGTTKIIGIYESEELAVQHDNPERRCFVLVYELNQTAI